MMEPTNISCSKYQILKASNKKGWFLILLVLGMFLMGYGLMGSEIIKFI